MSQVMIVSLLTVLLLHLRFIGISANECGTVQFIDPKIMKGTATVRGAWPFLAALHYVKQSKFFCGATVISSKNILTAAHCVQQKSSHKKLAPEDVTVLLGAYNLHVKVERGVQQRNVTDMYVHPDWRVFEDDKYDADLAIFVLSEIVEFTNYIRPICMPDEDPPIDAKGSIVGWGLSDSTTEAVHEAVPLHVFTQVLNDSYCYTTQPSVAIFSSTRIFCGDGLEGGSPNHGDSGGGLFVKRSSAWIQYGVISASISDGSNSVVSPDSFSIYTNVYKFKSWINETLAKSGQKDKLEIDLRCNYEVVLEVQYRCVLYEANVTNENSLVNLFTGTHQTSYDAQDVSIIWFWTGTLEYIPDGIGKKFQNLKEFRVGFHDKNLGLKLLRRRNFKDMELLTTLDVRFNNVESVDEDALRDLPNLKYFVVKNNKLRVLQNDTFDKNVQLIHVDASSNQLEFLPADLFKHNPLLKEIFFNNNKLKTIPIDFRPLKVIEKINFLGNTCTDDAGFDDGTSLERFQHRLIRCGDVAARIFYSM